MDFNVSCKCSKCGQRMEFDTTLEEFNLILLMKALQGTDYKCTQCALKDWFGK